VSSTVMIWMVCGTGVPSTAVLPQASVAVHVRVMTHAFSQSPDSTSSVKLTTGLGSHVSVEVACPVLAGWLDSSHSMVTSAGT